MPHCRNCGNPVSKTERECNVCGSSLNAGSERGRDLLGYNIRSSLGSDDALYKKDGYSPSKASSPYPNQGMGPRVWSPRKLLAGVLVLAILMPIIVYLLFAFPGFETPVTSTPSGGFVWVANEDNQTVRATFDDFNPTTRFEDCSFCLSIGAWTSPIQGVMTGETLFQYSPDYYAIVFFWDQEGNGIVDAGDYCNIYSPDIPPGLQCTIELFYEPTGGIICSASFAFL